VVINVRVATAGHFAGVAEMDDADDCTIGVGHGEPRAAVAVLRISTVRASARPAA
jgi:hypothetical protein